MDLNDMREFDGDAKIPSFTELVGDESDFFANYFGRRPLYRPSALGDSSREFLTVADLDRLLYSEAVRPPHIRLFSGGRELAPRAYTRVMRAPGQDFSDCVDPDSVIEQFRNGASITWKALNHVLPSIRALTAMLVERFATRCDAVAFLTPAAQQCFNAHLDPVDTLVVQLHGSKSWRVWPVMEDGDEEASELDVAELGEPTCAVSLRPGDVMYVPAGAPHVVVAEDGMSLHISVIIVPRRWSDILRWIVGQTIEKDPEFAELAYLGRANRVNVESGLRRATEKLVHALATLDATRIVDELIEDASHAAGSCWASPFGDLARAEGRSETV
jgi:bifunctional lysine-specific demethylase and histidyl-hydroxylase NO66